MERKEGGLSEWLISKILVYLKSKEGFSTPFGVDESDLTKVIVQDSMGFRYEIAVKNIGRSPTYSLDERIELKDAML